MIQTVTVKELTLKELLILVEGFLEEDKIKSVHIEKEKDEFIIKIGTLESDYKTITYEIELAIGFLNQGHGEMSITLAKEHLNRALGDIKNG